MEKIPTSCPTDIAPSPPGPMIPPGNLFSGIQMERNLPSPTDRAPSPPGLLPRMWPLMQNISTMLPPPILPGAHPSAGSVILLGSHC